MKHYPETPHGVFGDLDPKIVAVLTYIFPPFSGMFFLLVEIDDKRIKLHAWNSIVFGYPIFILWLIERILTVVLVNYDLLLSYIFLRINFIVALECVVLWILMMYRARRGAILDIPLLTKFARTQVDK